LTGNTFRDQLITGQGVLLIKGHKNSLH